MRSLLPALVTLSLAAALATTVSPASAAGETCQGLPATHVGSENVFELEGTEGNDVIVTNGAQDIRALGGDDLICVTEDATVDAGAGNDVVDATATAAFGINKAVLGVGADRYIGSAAGDTVTAGTDATPSVDTEPDVIDTGVAGADEDLVTSGQVGVANPDQVNMVKGTLTWLGMATETTALDGGGFSRLSLELDGPAPATLDHGTQTLATAGSPTLSFTGFAEFRVVARKGSGPFEFRGTDAREALEITPWRGLVQRVDMGAGNDRLSVSSRFSLHRRTQYDGGAGINDTLELIMPKQRDVDLDLRRGRLSTGQEGEERTTPANGFERAAVQAQDVELIGTNRGDSLGVHACKARVEGLGGVDNIHAINDRSSRKLPCQGRGMTFLGGSGGDVLIGTLWPDRLIGGPGRDTAVGGRGRDVCDAERQQACEVRLRP